jgi:hypothetical protein
MKFLEKFQEVLVKLFNHFVKIIKKIVSNLWNFLILCLDVSDSILELFNAFQGCIINFEIN